MEVRELRHANCLRHYALCRAMRLLRGNWPRLNPRLCDQGAIINCGTFTCAGSGLALLETGV